MNLIIERNVIALTNEINNSVEELHRYKRKGEKSSSFTKMKSLYVECLFDLSILLPMKMNFPMICPPLPWSVRDKKRYRDGRVPSFSALSGGYLSNPTGELMNSYRLLTSHEYDHFKVKFYNLDSFEKMCNIISKLQETPTKKCSDLFKITRNISHLWDFLSGLHSWLVFILIWFTRNEK